MNLSSSLEDYLEAILDIRTANGRVRITDISSYLNVQKSSVNSAIRKLKNLNLVMHEKYEDIVLTKQGEIEANRVRNRHDVLFEFFADFLGVKKTEAEKDACRIEHAIGPNTFERLKKFINYLKKSPDFDKTRWLDVFEDSIEPENSE